LGDVFQILFSLFFNFFNSSFVIIKNLLLSFGRIFGLNLNPPVVKFSKIHGKEFLIIERKTVPPIIQTPLLNKKFTREDFPLILAIEESRKSELFSLIQRTENFRQEILFDKDILEKIIYFANEDGIKTKEKFLEKEYEYDYKVSVQLRGAS